MEHQRLCRPDVGAKQSGGTAQECGIVCDLELRQLGAALAATALAEKLAALATEDYITQRGQRASAEKFAAALASVPDVPPMAGDAVH